MAADSPVMILLVGMTGAGKTTFASLASGRADLEIGTGLDPCTQDPCAVEFKLRNRTVILIDTPGFDDDARSDVEILESIAKWMVKQGYSKQQPLDGLILLHPIFAANGLDSGTERKRTRILQKILGEDAYRRVVIATTMWGVLNDEEDAQRDIHARWTRGGVWDEFRRGGSTMVRHYNTKESTDRILQSIIDRSDEAGRTQSQIQRDLAKKNVRFRDTAIGEELSDQLDEEICLIQNQLLEHRRERPPDSWRKSRNRAQREMWKEWDDEYSDLVKSLQARQAASKKMNSYLVSVFFIILPTLHI